MACTFAPICIEQSANPFRTKRSASGLDSDGLVFGEIAKNVAYATAPTTTVTRTSFDFGDLSPSWQYFSNTQLIDEDAGETLAPYQKCFARRWREDGMVLRIVGDNNNVPSSTNPFRTVRDEDGRDADGLLLHQLEGPLNISTAVMVADFSTPRPLPGPTIFIHCAFRQKQQRTVATSPACTGKFSNEEWSTRSGATQVKRQLLRSLKLQRPYCSRVRKGTHTLISALHGDSAAAA